MDDRTPCDPLLTYAEAAALLGVKLNTVYALVSQGRVPHVRIGPRFVRFRASDLDRWVNERVVVGAPAGETTAPKRSGSGSR